MASVALSSKAVGSIVKLNVGGVAKNFIVVHQGRPSSLYDTSCDGTWLLMEDCYESKRWHSSNVNDYANSEIRSYLNSTFLNLFDANIKSAIKQVKLPYRAGSGYGTTITSGANGLSTKIFLLSGPEVNWTSSTHSYIPNDGACLSYFSGCATTDAKRIAKLNGSAVGWSSTPMATGTTATAPTRMASAPLWYFPLLSWSLMMVASRLTQRQPSPAASPSLAPSWAAAPSP